MEDAAFEARVERTLDRLNLSKEALEPLRYTTDPVDTGSDHAKSITSSSAPSKPMIPVPPTQRKSASGRAARGARPLTSPAKPPTDTNYEASVRRYFDLLPPTKEHVLPSAEAEKPIPQPRSRRVSTHAALPKASSRLNLISRPTSSSISRNSDTTISETAEPDRPRSRKASSSHSIEQHLNSNAQIRSITPPSLSASQSLVIDHIVSEPQPEHSDDIQPLQVQREFTPSDDEISIEDNGDEELSTKDAHSEAGPISREEAKDSGVQSDESSLEVFPQTGAIQQSQTTRTEPTGSTEVTRTIDRVRLEIASVLQQLEAATPSDGSGYTSPLYPIARSPKVQTYQESSEDYTAGGYPAPLSATLQDSLVELLDKKRPVLQESTSDAFISAMPPTISVEEEMLLRKSVHAYADRLLDFADSSCQEDSKVISDQQKMASPTEELELVWDAKVACYIDPGSGQHYEVET